MTRRRFRLLLAASTLLALLALWYSLTPFDRGVYTAHFDQTFGRLAYKTYGKPAPWSGEYHRLLYDRYGVNADMVAGCVVTKDDRDYSAGYNAVAEPRILARFGRDIREECDDDACKAWNRKHPTFPFPR